MTNRHKRARSVAMLLVLGLSVLAGCEETGILGKWEGTRDGKKHKLEFQSNGRLYQNSDIFGYEGMSKWKVIQTTFKSGVKKITIEKIDGDSSEKKKLYITFTNVNEIRISSDFSNLRYKFNRNIALAEGDSKNHLLGYLLVGLAICFGMIAVCLPSFRRFEAEVKRDVFAKEVKP